MKFHIGQRVKLVSPHEFDGRTFAYEAQVGDIGIVNQNSFDRTFVKPAVHVHWVYRVEPDFSRTSESAVDEDCLELDLPTIGEDPW